MSRFRIPCFVILLLLVASPSRAQLNQKQARNLITKMAGMSLPGKSVRVGKVNITAAAIAESSAELELAFRIMQNESGQWRVSEIRIGQDRWEQLDVVAEAMKFDLPRAACDPAGQSEMGTVTSELSVKRARCLIADLFGVTLPSDAVRIKEISGLSLGTRASALLVALVQADFRFVKDQTGWHVSELRTGNREWSNIENIATAIDSVKRLRATAELTMVANALQAFSRERGSFVVSDKHPVLIDHLSPRYLARVIRVDPWHHPYQYQGERDHFTLRSYGPDGKENTPDDVVVSGPMK